MNKDDREELIAHLEAALAILRKPDVTAQGGGNQDPPPKPG